jgi:hypothetical protein
MERLRAVRSTSFRIARRRCWIVPAQARLTTTAFLMLIIAALTRQQTTLLLTHHTHGDARYPTTLLFATIDMR